MNIHILRLPDVCKRTGLSRSSIYDFEKRGQFPKRIRLSARAVGWVEADIETWLADRPAL